MAYVYIHKKVIDNEVFYVGIANKPFKRAYIKHQRSELWKRITMKYEYVVEITHTDIIWEQAQSIERYLISFYGRIDTRTGTLANHTEGGEGCLGMVITDSWRRKNSEIKKGKIFTEEHKRNISIAKKGKPLIGQNLERSINQLNDNRQKGIDAARTKDAIEKRVASTKANYKISLETRKKMSEAGKKKIFSESHRKNLSISLLNNKNRIINN